MKVEAHLEPLYSAEDIANRLKALAIEIAAEMPPDFVAIAILKGSFVFAADLVRALAGRNINPEVDFMTIASYGRRQEMLAFCGTPKLTLRASTFFSLMTFWIADERSNSHVGTCSNEEQNLQGCVSCWIKRLQTGCMSPIRPISWVFPAHRLSSQATVWTMPISSVDCHLSLFYVSSGIG
jgi:hypothetical protein